MSWNWRRVLGWIFLCLGCLSMLIGVWSIGGYIWGVVSVLDEPDQSWIFWGLIFVLIGIAGIVLGAAMAFVGWSMVKKK